VTGTWQGIPARMEEITAPVRLSPLEDVAVPEAAREAIDRLGAFHNHPRGMKLDGFFATICRSPDVFSSYVQLGADLSTQTTLSPRARELAILRTGWLCGAPYQWGEHVRAGKTAGLTSEEIVRVREGSGADGWSDEDKALLTAAEELHARAMLSDATWAALAIQLDERQRLELLLLVGHYHLTAFVQNALRTPLNPGNGGLAAA
jgi:4-carboxymuconolactone decarboxylase